jgi:muconate cycloisomerase
MQITKITTHPVRIPLKPEFRMVSSLGRHEVSNYVIVRVETDVDIDGIGEATVMCRWSGETVWSALSIIDHIFAPQLIGVDPCDIDTINSRLDRLSQGNWFAKAAIEMACQDIRGKDAGVPLYQLLNPDGAVRDLTIPCRFSMGAYNPERAERRAKELVAAGFTTIKVKVGLDTPGDVIRVATVRQAIGPELDMVIDANCGYSAEEAVIAADKMSDLNIGLFEQPTPRGDFAALAHVRQNTSMAIMADDICFDLADARECIRAEACDVISVYPGKNGGIQRSQEIVDFAAEHNVACSIGSNLELDIASAAMCHLVVACKNMNVEKWPGDIMGPDYHSESVVANRLKIDGSTITVSDRPGLGVDADWAAVERLKMP